MSDSELSPKANRRRSPSYEAQRDDRKRSRSASPHSSRNDRRRLDDSGTYGPTETNEAVNTSGSDLRGSISHGSSGGGSSGYGGHHHHNNNSNYNPNNRVFRGSSAMSKGYIRRGGRDQPYQRHGNNNYNNNNNNNSYGGGGGGGGNMFRGGNMRGMYHGGPREISDEALLESPVLVSLEHYAAAKRGANAAIDDPIERRYMTYKEDHARKYRDMFVSAYGKENWFREKYAPEKLEETRKEMAQTCKLAAEKYWASFDKLRSLIDARQQSQLSQEQLVALTGYRNLNLSSEAPKGIPVFLSHTFDEEMFLLKSSIEPEFSPLLFPDQVAAAAAATATDAAEPSLSASADPLGDDVSVFQIFIPQVPAPVSRQALLDHIVSRKLPGFISLALSAPLAAQLFTRCAWICFDSLENMNNAITKLHAAGSIGTPVPGSGKMIVSGTDVAYRRSFLHIRILDPAQPFGAPNAVRNAATVSLATELKKRHVTPISLSEQPRIIHDIIQAWKLMLALDKEREITSNRFTRGPVAEVQNAVDLETFAEPIRLDLMISYLRQVHFFCYYSGQGFTNAEELIKNCGDAFFRGVPIVSDSNEIEEGEELPEGAPAAPAPADPKPEGDDTKDGDKQPAATPVQAPPKSSKAVLPRRRPDSAFEQYLDRKIHYRILVSDTLMSFNQQQQQQQQQSGSSTAAGAAAGAAAAASAAASGASAASSPASAAKPGADANANSADDDDDMPDPDFFAPFIMKHHNGRVQCLTCHKSFIGENFLKKHILSKHDYRTPEDIERFREHKKRERVEKKMLAAMRKLYEADPNNPSSVINMPHNMQSPGGPHGGDRGQQSTAAIVSNVSGLALPTDPKAEEKKRRGYVDLDSPAPELNSTISYRSVVNYNSTDDL